MKDDGSGISELNPNPFETGLSFDSHPHLGLGRGSEIVWGSPTRPIAMPGVILVRIYIFILIILYN